MIVPPNKKLKETIYDEPTSSVFNLTLNMCKEWLREYNLDGQGKVNDLKASSRNNRNTDTTCVFIGKILSTI